MTLSAPPPMTQIAADAYALAEPLCGPEAVNGFPIAVLFGGIGEMFRDVETLVRARPGREPWQQAFDIDAPGGGMPTFEYPWFGQIFGVRDLVGLTTAQQYTKIKQQQAIYRGGIDALKSAVAATLSPPASVAVIEGNPDADHITVIVDPAQVTDITKTTQAANAAKLFGLLLTIVQSSLPIIDQGTRTIDAATAAVTIDGATLADIT